MFNGGKRNSNETYIITIRKLSQNDKNVAKKFFNYNFLVLIFIACNIKTNDFHFILDVSQETAMRGRSGGESETKGVEAPPNNI